MGENRGVLGILGAEEYPAHPTARGREARLDNDGSTLYCHPLATFAADDCPYDDEECPQIAQPVEDEAAEIRQGHHAKPHDRGRLLLWPGQCSDDWRCFRGRRPDDGSLILPDECLHLSHPRGEHRFATGLYPAERQDHTCHQDGEQHRTVDRVKCLASQYEAVEGVKQRQSHGPPYNIYEKGCHALFSFSSFR